MTQEEKAQAYDKAVEIISGYYQKIKYSSFSSASNDREVLERAFPQLKESEDERIRKELIKVFSNKEKYLIDQSFGDITASEALAWLEKQGENKANKMPIWKHWKDGIAGGSKGEQIFLIKNGLHYSISSCLGYECDYIELSELDKLLSEKQGEPKFHEGDWIVNNNSGSVYQVTEIRDDEYCLWPIDGEIMGYLRIIDVEDDYHLWTIQDAKDGDVLVTCFEEDNIILMYHSMCTIDTINVHCCLDNKFTRANLGVFDAEDVKPATKEQRDLLFQKMKEAGYEWDTEKKELKKIHVIDEGKAEMDYCFTKMMNGEKVKPQSPTPMSYGKELEARMYEACNRFDAPNTDPNRYSAADLFYAGVKAERDLNMVSWSEKDENVLEDIEEAIINYWHGDTQDNLLDWLKSLKDRYTWKPSDEQMIVLQEAIGIVGQLTPRGECLKELVKQLKKLMEE